MNILCRVERSLQSKDHTRLSENVSEIAGGLSSSSEMNFLMTLNYMLAKQRKHLVTTTQVTLTAMEMTWHLMETEISSIVCCLQCFHLYIRKVRNKLRSGAIILLK